MLYGREHQQSYFLKTTGVCSLPPGSTPSVTLSLTLFPLFLRKISWNVLHLSSFIFRHSQGCTCGGGFLFEFWIQARTFSGALIHTLRRRQISTYWRPHLPLTKRAAVETGVNSILFTADSTSAPIRQAQQDRTWLRNLIELLRNFTCKRTSLHLSLLCPEKYIYVVVFPPLPP